ISWKERPSSLEQIGGGAGVPAVERAAPRRGKTGCGALGELVCPVAGRAKFGEVVVRLLEVVTDDLVELVPSAVEPIREALVQLRAESLRDPVVRGISDQHVSKAEAVLDRLVRADQLLTHKRRKHGPRGAPTVGSESCERFPFEVEPDDGCALERIALLVR